MTPIYRISTDRCVVEISLVLVMSGLPPYAQSLPLCVSFCHFCVIVTDFKHAKEEDNSWKCNVYFFSVLIIVLNSLLLQLLLSTRLTPKR